MQGLIKSLSNELENMKAESGAVFEDETDFVEKLLDGEYDDNDVEASKMLAEIFTGHY